MMWTGNVANMNAGRTGDKPSAVARWGRYIEARSAWTDTVATVMARSAMA